MIRKGKEQRAMIGGILSLIIGFWIAFISKNQMGAIPNSVLGMIFGSIGVLLILWRWK